MDHTKHMDEEAHKAELHAIEANKKAIKAHEAAAREHTKEAAREKANS